jgi:hypothetical protein
MYLPGYTPFTYKLLEEAFEVEDSWSPVYDLNWFSME